MKNKKIGWLAGVFVISGILWYAASSFKKENPPELKEKEIEAVAVKAENTLIKKSYIGYVTPVNAVDVRPQISGFIKEVLISGGQKVKAGDKLLVIDQRSYEATLEAVSAAADKASAEYLFAKDYYERVEKAGDKAFSLNEIKDAKTKYLAAQMTLKQALSEVKKAEVDLSYTVIYATIDGISGNIGLSVGDYISPQAKLFEIIQTDPIRVVFSITDKDYLSESRLPRMFENEKITVTLADGSIYPYKGVFGYADNKIDRATNAVAVYADFANPRGELISNAYVTVDIEKQYRGVVIAKDLVNLNPEGNFVYVAKNGKISRHTAEIVSDYGNNYVLNNNFTADMSLIKSKITPQDLMRPYKIVNRS
ncbi:MAG: efflux RND transporter periplasmic adaptor subunit [Alphaproteobacteria bacterium]|nr:efflux RND transporter periplasmic adaptor subunit [Alphaproteobacteria bacterium]